MKNVFLVITACCLLNMHLSGQTNDEDSVRLILKNQTEAWNKGNIDEFMKGYWNSDSLLFIGKSGVTYGYQNTLNNYKRNYDSPDKMGKLSFELIQVRRLSRTIYFVVAKWHLERNAGNVGGHFDLIFQKIDGSWKIISDHSS